METNLKYLTHETSLKSLYCILDSGFLKKSSETKNIGLSSETKGDKNYVYLGLSESVPLVGSVRLFLSPEILNNNNYYLNNEWKYGIDENTLKNYSKIIGRYSEILFDTHISLDTYLIKIVVPQYHEDVLLQLSKRKYMSHDILDLSKIKQKYHNLIQIVIE